MSVAVPPVERLPVDRRKTRSPSAGTVSLVYPFRASDEALDDDTPAVLPCHLERLRHLLPAHEMDRDASAMVSIVRLYHHGIADPLGRRDCILRGLNQALLRYRKAEIPENPVRLLFVGGKFDGDVGGSAGDGRLDSLLIAAVAELDQALVVEAYPRDPPLLGGPHQGHR